MSKPDKKPIENVGDVVLETMNQMVDGKRDGKIIRLPAFEAALEVCFEKAALGDDAAKKALEQVLQISGAYDPEVKDEGQGSVLVVYAPLPKDRWLAEARKMRVSINPLEGIPGTENFVMDRERGRDRESSDDYDPTES